MMRRKGQRLVIKFGTGILTRVGAEVPDTAQFRRLSREVAELVSAGHECVIVSSGAVAAGLSALGLQERPADLPTRQACAAVGQSKLMRLYETNFAKHGLNVAQLLLAHGDIDSRTRSANAKNTLRRLLECRNVVPIINENDSVAVEELRFGDNDRLSAEVAMLAEADLLIMLTTVAGLMRNADGHDEVIDVVTDLDAVTSLARDEKGKLSVGGMVSKLQAVRIAVGHGITTVIASGRTPGQIAAIVRGENAGTRFLAG